MCVKRFSWTRGVGVNHVVGGPRLTYTNQFNTLASRGASITTKKPQQGSP